MKHTLLPMLAAVLALVVPVGAQAPAPLLFPFVIPWDDASPGTATDVSFLNVKPAGAHGTIVARNGHFVETNTGTRVRFLGVNLVGQGAFPTHADADKVAARMAKLGINLVRLHHMDNPGWGPHSNLWDAKFADRQHIDPEQLDRLDYLIAQLKKNGIYVNINLHVSRQFTPADGFPESVSKLPDFDKRVDEFDPRMIALQKNFARDLLTHVNSYTHLPYTSDPAVAVVEINNENSLVGDPWATLGAGLDTLPAPFRGELMGLWNVWLAKKYGTDAKLNAAWLVGVTPTAPGLLTSISPWSIEHQGTSEAAIVDEIYLSHRNGVPDTLRVNITKTDGTGWHVQVHQTGLDLKSGDTYTVTFRAKADAPRSLPVAAGMDEADWHNVGLDTTAVLTTEWQTFQYVFAAHDAVPQHSRLAFTLGGQTGTVWIDLLKIHPGADGVGLTDGQSLAARTVDIPVSSTKAQHADWLAFLADTERNYADEMRGYLRDTLHVKANIICSQISWGGLTGLSREAGSDFADNHAYWQHPSFPRKAWDPKDWTIPNTPMVTDLANGGGGTFRDLAENRVAGKPYSISEYNHAAPNDYRAETLPLIASFAAFQDWDMIYLFDYGEYGVDAHNDKVNGYFGIGSDPAKTAFLPADVLMFRTDGIPAAAIGQTLLNSVAGALTAESAWKLRAVPFFSSRIALASELSANLPYSTVSVTGGPPLLLTLPHSGPIHSVAPAQTNDPARPQTLAVTKTSAGGQYRAVSPEAATVVGYVGGQTVTLGDDTLIFPKFGNNFAAATLTATDGKPLAESRRLLLTLAGKVENQDMGWNATRTSVGDQWGHGPTVAEGIPAAVTLKTSAARHVWALDGTGKRVQQVPATYANGALMFTVGPQFRTLWYEVEE